MGVTKKKDKGENNLREEGRLHKKYK